MVKNFSFRTATSLVVREHGHQVGVATLAVVCAVVYGGVAALLTTITSLNEGLVAVGVKNRFPFKGAVPF